MFRGKRVLTIINPASGGGSREDLVDSVAPGLQSHGAAHTEVRITQGPDDAFDWAAAAEDEGFDVVVVGGGDGTVTAVGHGVLHSGGRLPIGILPLGTGNGLARVLGLPLDLEQTVDALAGGRIVAIDAISLPTHDTISLLFFGAGLDAKINRDADTGEKARLGPFAYLKAAAQNLRRARNCDLTLLVDGEVRRFRGHSVSGFNATRLDVLGIPAGPDADPHDGRMNLTVFTSRNSWRTLGQILRLINRAASRGDLELVRGFRLDAVPPLPVQADGDVVGETPLEAEVLPRALRFIAAAEYTGDRGIAALASPSTGPENIRTS
jgi:diacylglycerol kinase family enzyme